MKNLMFGIDYGLSVSTGTRNEILSDEIMILNIS